MIKFKLVYNILPVIILYLSLEGGRNLGPIVFINKDLKWDKGLLEHELTHVKQWYRLPVLHNILYIVSDKYKLKSELEAYKNQIPFARDQEFALSLAAHKLANNYKLKVSYEDARNYLLDK